MPHIPGKHEVIDVTFILYDERYLLSGGRQSTLYHKKALRPKPATGASVRRAALVIKITLASHS